MCGDASDIDLMMPTPRPVAKAVGKGGGAGRVGLGELNAAMANLRSPMLSPGLLSPDRGQARKTARHRP